MYVVKICSKAQVLSFLLIIVLKKLCPYQWVLIRLKLMILYNSLSFFMIPGSHHVRDIRCDRLNLPHELVANFSILLNKIFQLKYYYNSPQLPQYNHFCRRHQFDRDWTVWKRNRNIFVSLSMAKHNASQRLAACTVGLGCV